MLIVVDRIPFAFQNPTEQQTRHLFLPSVRLRPSDRHPIYRGDTAEQVRDMPHG
jgi:hypothetical protein